MTKLSVTQEKLAEYIYVGLQEELAQKIKLKLHEVADKVVYEVANEIVSTLKSNVDSWYDLGTDNHIIKLTINGIEIK